MKVSIHEFAAKELDEATEWYDLQSKQETSKLVSDGIKQHLQSLHPQVPL